QHTKKILDETLKEKTEIKLKINQLNDDVEDAEEVVEFGKSKLSAIGEAWKQIEDMNVKSRFQKWLFPAGLTFDGEIFGTSQIPLCLSIKKELSEENSLLVNSLVLI